MFKTLTERDLNFLVETVAPEVVDKVRLKPLNFISEHFLRYTKSRLFA
jgi:hypothetical protein